MNDKTLYKRQVALLIFFIPLVFKLSILPALLANAMSNDAWVGILFIVVVEFIQLAVIVQILNIGGLKALKEKLPKPVYIAILTPLLFVFAVKSLIFLSEMINYVTSYLFYNAPSSNICVILLIAISYVAVKGARAIGRLGEIMIWLVPTIILVGFGFGKVELQVEYIFPIFAEGVAPIFTGIDKHILWMFDFSPLLFFTLSETKKKRPYILIASILSILAVVGTYAVFMMNYGDAAHLIDCAFARLAAFNVVSTEIGSIDWPGIMLWLMMGVITLATKFFASGEILQEYKIKNSYGIIAMAVIIGGVYLLLITNIEGAINLATSYIRYIVIGLEIVIPFLILILLYVLKGAKKLNVKKN